MKKSEGGMGGKLGHSRMSHWMKTAEVKADARRIRRANDRKAIKESRSDG